MAAPDRARAGACARMLLRLVGACLLVGLSACSTAPREAPPEPEVVDRGPQLGEEARWAVHYSAVLAMTDWEARGKVAYRMPDDSGSANLTWQQDGDRSELRLSGPLGTGATTIRNDGALIRVARDGIERLYPADAAPWLPGGELLPIPITSIRHWLRGIPDPALAVDVLELEDARAATVSQLGWIVEIDAYDETVSPPLPSRLRITAPVADLTLRALLRDWSRGE